MPRNDRPGLLAPLLLLPLAALLAVHPLLAHGVSCGQDLGFHLQSWLDAAAQLRQGRYPHWAFSPAWNAGEPRFVFYPPLSWLLGALLVGVSSASLAPTLYVFLALAAAGLAMHRLAGEYVSPGAALVASAFYLANPYMLFCAFERAAFAELLAAAWMPLLLLAVLRRRPTARGVAVPVALLWLTNAPAAVMGCYAFALLASLRVLSPFLQPPGAAPEEPTSPPPIVGAPERSRFVVLRVWNRSGFRTGAVHPLRLALTYLQGASLGLALPAFYLIPAAYGRRHVQVNMAIVPSLSVAQNFLFAHTADAAHDAVNRTASVLALTLMLLTGIVLAALLVPRRRGPERDEPQRLVAGLAVLTGVIVLLLTPVSLPIWRHLPDMQYLQFPWRLLCVLSTVLALALALLLDRASATSLAGSYRVVCGTAMLLTLALSAVGYRLYAQGCEVADRPGAIAALFRTHHGAPPTDEYTPLAADNDVLRTDDPGYWLAATPTAAAPNSTPTAAELDPKIEGDDTPVPDAQTLSAAAPTHHLFRLQRATFLVLNLRDYPAWRVVCNGLVLGDHLRRDDGLIAVALPAGASAVDVRWHDTPDQVAGLIVSACALLLLVAQAFSRGGL